MTRDELGLLSRIALDHGVPLSEHHLDLFRLYLAELWEWNKRMNLTGLSSPERIQIELLLDSLIPAPFLPQEGRLLDVGSGAGFPGLPLKIFYPGLKTHLLEATARKVSFLKQMIRLLGLQEIEAIRGRIEKDAHLLDQAGYHLITARAFAPLGQTLSWCAPFLLPGGVLVTFLGPRPKEDLKGCRKTMDENEMSVYRTIPYLLPGKQSQRNTVLFKKNPTPPAASPSASGEFQAKSIVHKKGRNGFP